MLDKEVPDDDAPVIVDASDRTYIPGILVGVKSGEDRLMDRLIPHFWAR
jgi:hypothetical protein